MPEPPPGGSNDASPGRLAADASSDRPAAGRRRGPGWREVLLLAGAILVAVFALEVASALLPPVRDAFSGFPLTIAVLVGGTTGLLLLGALRRPRR